MLRASRLLPWEDVAMLNILFNREVFPIQHVLQFPRYSSQSHGAGVSEMFVHEIARSVYSLLRARRKMMSNIGQPPLPLLYNMERYHGLECRDPRDHIFGLLAISSDSAKLAITPDYSAENHVTNAFLEASVRILQTSADLYLLEAACYFDNTSPIYTMPSWALNVPRPAEKNLDVITADLCPHPEKSIQTPLRFPADFTTLILKGRILDSIALSTLPMYTSEYEALFATDRSFLRSGTDLLSNCARMLHRTGVSIQHLAALCHCLTLELQLEKSYEEAAFSLWCFIRQMIGKLKYHPTSVDADATEAVLDWDALIKEFSRVFAACANSQKGSLSAPDVLTSHEDALGTKVHNQLLILGRSLCVTEHNRVCSGQNEVRSDDVVAAFEGSDKLFVLRPTRHQYRLVGEAWVDGLNLGEAYEGLDPKDVDYDIELI